METAKQTENLKLSIGNKQPVALVAGGAGFLGSHLCEALLSQGFGVVAVDDLSIASTKHNIEELLSLPNFAFWEADINKADFKLSPTMPVTHVFHLAAVEEHLDQGKLSLQTLLVNSLGTKNLLDLATQRKAKFILASSSEVFHAAISQVSLESYFGKNIEEAAQLSFSEAKRFAESLTAEYYKKYGLQTAVLRIKDPYGPRMNLVDGGPLAHLINEAVQGSKIELAGDGLKTLNPTFVTDIAFGIIKAVLQDYTGKIFNLVSPEKYTERSVAEALQKIVGNIEIVYKKESGWELPEYPLIINPAEEKLGWRPKTSLDVGLTETVNYFRKKNAKEKEEEKERDVTVDAPKQIKRDKEKSNRVNRFFVKLIIGTLAILIGWAIIVPPFVFAVNIFSAGRNLDRAQLALGSENLQEAEAKATSAESGFKSSGEAASSLFWPSVLPGLSTWVKQTRNYLFFAENLSASAKQTSQALAFLEKAYNANEEEKAEGELKRAKEKLSLAKRNLEMAYSVKVNKNGLPPPLQDDYQKLEGFRKVLEEIITSLESVL